MHRKLMGYSCAQVAKLLELQTTAQLSQWERGSCLPSVVNLFKLSIIYRTFPNELYLEYIQELKAEIQQQELKLLTVHK